MISTEFYNEYGREIKFYLKSSQDGCVHLVEIGLKSVEGATDASWIITKEEARTVKDFLEAWLSTFEAKV